jgi:hypothetical protein
MLLRKELFNLDVLGNIIIPDMEEAAILLRKNSLGKLASILDDLVAEKHLVDIESGKVKALSESDVMPVFDKA